MAVLVVAVAFAGMVSSFGIGSSYWKGQPFTIAPGETKTANLYMQNMVGEEAVSVRVEVKQGRDIASVDEREYTVPFGVDDMVLPVEISVPADVEVGTMYPVVVSFITVGEPGSGTISLGTAYDISFDVEVVSESSGSQEVEGGSNLGFIVVTLLVLIILIVVVTILIRKKN